MSQHDYVVGNDTGIAVRSDINSALQAIVSQNSGTSEPTAKFAYMFWADTTNGLLKQRDSSNSFWVVLGTLDVGANATALANALILRDANANAAVNNILNGLATTATAAATTTLVVGSKYFQYFTGTTTQTVALPVVSTLLQGQSFFIKNNSTGTVTVQSSGGNTVATLLAGSLAIVTCILITGTSPASWDATVVSGFPISTSSTASTIAARDGNANLSSNIFLPGFLKTSSTSSKTLSVTDAEIQYYTGGSGQTWKLPLTTSLVNGYTIKILNFGSGALAVQSNGAGAIVSIPVFGACTLICIDSSTDAAASWVYVLQNVNGSMIGTGWTSFTPSITGTTSNPSIGSSAAWGASWRRVGDTLECRGILIQASAGSAGSGTYLMQIPNSLNMNGSLINPTTSGSGADGSLLGVCGISTTLSAGTLSAFTGGHVYPYDLTHLRFTINNSTYGELEAWGSTYFPLSSPTLYMNFDAKVPISGWNWND